MVVLRLGGDIGFCGVSCLILLRGLVRRRFGCLKCFAGGAGV